MAKKEKAKFLCFGAAGEVVIRVLLDITYDFPNYVKVQGAPFIRTKNGRAKNYVKAPLGTIAIGLILQDEKTATVSVWNFEEVTPVNEPAIRLMAKFKWQRQKDDFKDWRKEYGIRRPTLQEHLKQIQKIKLK